LLSSQKKWILEAKLNEQLKFLIELQKIDTSILSMAESIEVLPRQLNQHKAPLKEKKESLQKAGARLDALNKKKKDKDSQLEEIQDKIEKLKARGSDIKTNKEYEAHLREIETFEKNVVKIEDEILVLMEDIDAFDRVMKEEGQKVKQAEDDYKKQEKIIEDDQKKAKTEMEHQKARRNDFASRIDKEHYTQYMALMKRLGGLAVVETKNEICLGCNTNIPPQLYNEIKSDKEIHVCFYCRRFLYYKEPVHTETESRESTPSS
jgi:predicted  nucleic acid-binding Zn-ribbon protein